MCNILVGDRFRRAQTRPIDATFCNKCLVLPLSFILARNLFPPRRRGIWRRPCSLSGRRVARKIATLSIAISISARLQKRGTRLGSQILLLEKGREFIVGRLNHNLATPRANWAAIHNFRHRQLPETPSRPAIRILNQRAPLEWIPSVRHWPALCVRKQYSATRANQAPLLGEKVMGTAAPNPAKTCGEDYANFTSQLPAPTFRIANAS